MIFPIGDTNVTGGKKPIVSYTLLAILPLVFALQLLTPGNLLCSYSAVPRDLFEGQNLLHLITHIFLHGGYLHLAGNLLFLWIFADNIEAVIGSWRFMVFFILGGVIAAVSHAYIDGKPIVDAICCDPCLNYPHACPADTVQCNEAIPMVGASGAISAVLGAYFVMFPKSRITLVVVIIFKRFYIWAYVFLGLWFLQQILAVVWNKVDGLPPISESVAWWAHIGGFVYGILCGLLFKSIKKKEMYFAQR